MSQAQTVPSDAPTARHTSASGPILVAAKGEGDEAKFRAARLLAGQTGARVRVVSALEPVLGFVLPLDASLPAAYERDRSSIRLRALEREMLGVLDEGETLWPTDLRVGDPVRVVADVARAAHASLIVMGIGRPDPLQRLLAAETTLATVRRAHVPVLVVAGDFAGPPRNIVAGVDFGVASIRALEVALSLVEPPATFHLVHTWPPLDSLHPLLRRRLGDYERTLPDRFACLRTALAVPEGVTIHTEWRPGKAPEEISTVALERHADLIVTGRSNRRKLDRLIAGSTSTAVLRAATCSVLVVPEPPAREVERIERAAWGRSESRSPEHWAAQLEAFARRNAGRRADLEVDDPAIGAQTQESGFVLRGASYDHRDGRVQLMLAAPDGTTHLSRSIGDVSSVAVLADDDRGGETLRILYGSGQVLLQTAPLV